MPVGTVTESAEAPVYVAGAKSGLLPVSDVTGLRERLVEKAELLRSGDDDVGAEEHIEILHRRST